MLIDEARWIGRTLDALPDSAFPLANIGSQTSHFRNERQPWIEESIFGPLAARGREVFHVDIQDDPGVDVVLDVVAPESADVLRRLGVRTILCANLLEHVERPLDFLDRLIELVPADGHLVLTGPHRFPYHADPLDTMFRPDAEEMRAHVGGRLEVLEASDRSCRRLLYYQSRDEPLRFALRMLVPFVKPQSWWRAVSWMPRKPVAYCLHLHRKAA